MTSKPTRQDYMNGVVSFADYYRAIARTAGVSYAKTDPQFLTRVRMSLNAGDEHLNRIPLAVWDMKVAALLPSVRAAFKAHDDRYSLAGGVCLLKQAARDAVKKEGR